MNNLRRAILNMQIAIAQSTENWGWLKDHRLEIAGLSLSEPREENPQSQGEEQ